MTISMRSWLAPAILGIAGAVVLGGLGFWQLARLEWKEALIAERRAELDAPGGDLADYLATPKTNAEFIPINDIVVYGDKHTDILGGGREGAGYRRIVSGQIGATAVMVEAGFLPEADKDAPYDLPQGAVPIEGHIYDSHGRLGSYDADRDVWVGYDIAQMATLLDTEPILIVARQSPVANWQSTPAAIDLPNNHFGYAVQWFALALAWSAMAFYWGYARMKRGKN